MLRPVFYYNKISGLRQLYILFFNQSTKFPEEEGAMRHHIGEADPSVQGEEVVILNNKAKYSNKGLIINQNI